LILYKALILPEVAVKRIAIGVFAFYRRCERIAEIEPAIGVELEFTDLLF